MNYDENDDLLVNNKALILSLNVTSDKSSERCVIAK